MDETNKNKPDAPEEETALTEPENDTGEQEGMQTQASPDEAPQTGEAADEAAKEPVPKKKRNAVIRCTAAFVVAAALLLVTNFGAFHLLFGGRELTAANMAANRYLTFNVDTIVDYLAEDYAKDSDTVTGRYVLVPADGSLIVVHLPQRYLDSGDTIATQTYYQLFGGATADKYFVASGVVKAVPEDVASKYAEWFNKNAVYMYQYGFIKSFDESTVTYMVDVDSTGLFGDTVCIILSGAASLALIYAVWELVRILMDKYGDNDGEITVEIFEEEPAEEAEAEPTEAPAEAAEAEEKPEDNNDA